jgi:hypothetical protein
MSLESIAIRSALLVHLAEVARSSASGSERPALSRLAASSLSVAKRPDTLACEPAGLSDQRPLTNTMCSKCDVPCKGNRASHRESDLPCLQ